MLFDRFRTVAATALLTVAAVAAPARPSPQPPPPAPDAVEEDWELIVEEPRPLEVGPQVTTVMSPVTGGAAPFFAFDVNYREFPVFAPGGMQVQVWSAGRVLDTAGQCDAQFVTPGERVTWTQRLTVSGGQLHYDIGRGQSTTWGNFGQGANLSVGVATPLTDLAGYDPAISAARSGVSWQANHVRQLVLRQVRYYANGQLLRTETDPRYVVDNTGP